MNNEESEFVPLAEKLSSPLPQKNSIIKGNKIRNIQTKLINISDEKRDMESITEEQNDTDSNNDDVSSKIEPILEDNNIVGITYTCRCGEKSEIKFNVEGEKTDDNVEGEKTDDNVEGDDEDSHTIEDTIIDE